MFSIMSAHGKHHDKASKIRLLYTVLIADLRLLYRNKTTQIDSATLRLQAGLKYNTSNCITCILRNGTQNRAVCRQKQQTVEVQWLYSTYFYSSRSELTQYSYCIATTILASNRYLLSPVNLFVFSKINKIIT